MLHRGIEFNAQFPPNATLYTLKTPVFGQALLNRYSAGQQHFADLTLVLNHWPLGSAHFLLNWCVDENEIPIRFQAAILEGIQRAARQLGQGIARVKVTVIGGNYLPKYSHDLMFSVATLMAFRDAMSKAELVTLESMV